jgi:transcription antitermination factor NusG
VARQFGQKRLEYLLPTYERFTRWSDRVKRIQTPLFPSYIFVYIAESERVQVLQTMGIVQLVSFAGAPAVLADEDIDRLRTCALRSGDVEPHPYLRMGRRVRVTHGPFAGWEGTLAEKQNSRRLIVTIEQICKSIAINLHTADVEPL